MFDEFEVRDEKAEAALKKIADHLRIVTPEGMGFTLMFYTFGEGGSMFYASNAKREDMIRAMQEFIAKHREN